MKSFKLLLFTIFCFVQYSFAQSDIVGLASPIQLQPDSTVIFVSDYFPFQSQIDSVKVADGLTLNSFSNDPFLYIMPTKSL